MSLRKPNWRKWGLIPKATLWEVVALSLDVDPDKIEGHRVEGVADLRILDTLHERLAVVLANLGRAPGLQKYDEDIADRSKTLIAISGFAAFAAAVQWPLPAEFPTQPLFTEPDPLPSPDRSVTAKPAPAFTDKPLTEGERQTLLKQVAALALCVAERGGKFKRGERPNANQIATLARDVAEALPGANLRGLSKDHLREAITAGLRLLVDS